MGRNRTVGSREARDTVYMRECFRLALLGEGRVSPNPLVGAVLVRNGRILSRGYHRRFGGPHAEVDCLERFKGDPGGSTMYVNLEPCAHFGKTPPCTRRIISAGVAEVVVAMQDPNPLVRGKGIRTLRTAGVKVRTGILRDEARRLNAPFVVGITRRRPYVHLKLAQSADGFLTDVPGHEKRISGSKARELVHRWRSRIDAVLVGAGTVRADDPALNVRLVSGRDPDVVIVDGHLTVPTGSRVFRTARRRRVFIVTGSRGGPTRKAGLELAKRGVTVIHLPGQEGRIPISEILEALYERQIGSILVEGGADIARQFLRQGLVDRLSVIVSPRKFGRGLKGISPDLALPRSRGGSRTVRRLGRDQLIDHQR
jgi:diaminohydroxyphosphoribosylaminopyrimidine deaminase/5-amino-6-(5-phosphoribosylamino)uracil reductase